MPQSAALTWERILQKLEETCFIADYMLLSNGDNLSGEVRDGELVLYTKNETIRSLLDQRHLGEIRSAASALAGTPVPVKTEIWTGTAAGRFDRLDELMERFK